MAAREIARTKGDVRRAVRESADLVKRLKEGVSAGVIPGDTLKKQEAVLKKLKEGGWESRPGEARANLYEQTFFTDRAPGDESHLLKWYEPVSEEQLGWVRNAAEKEGVLDDRFKNFLDVAEKRINGEVGDKANGESLYLHAEWALGSPQAASEFLARAGIDGVKYPVDSFGGKGVKDGDEAGWNYVSFRDDNIRVDHKWTDGQMRYSIAVTPEVRKATTVDTADMTRDKADAALRALAGRDLKNDETGIVAQVNSVQRRKILSNAAVRKSQNNGFSVNEHDAAASILETLWKVATLGKTDPDKNGDQSLKSVKRFVAPVRLGEKDAYAYITAKESVEHGHRIYSIELEKLEALAGMFKERTPRAANASGVPEGTARIIPQTGAPAQGGRFSIAGRQGAKRLRLKGVAEAAAMEKAGADREDIWRTTGWWRGRDGKWRVEIPDFTLNLAALEATGNDPDYFVRKRKLSEVISDTRLFDAYPDLKKITVETPHSDSFGYGSGLEGTFDGKGRIKLNMSAMDYDPAKVRATLAHEIQHAIQAIEGFAKGGNEGQFKAVDVRKMRRKAKSLRREGNEKEAARLEAEADELEENALDGMVVVHYQGYMDPFEAYQSLTGETEARNVEKRLAMTPEKRAATPPWESEDVPEDRQIVRYSIRSFADGTPFVEVDNVPPDIASETDLDRKRKLVERMLKDRWQGKILDPQGVRAFFNGHSAHEYTNPPNAPDDATMGAKMDAASGLEDIVGTSTNPRAVPDGESGHAHDNVKEWEHRDAIFRVDGRFYSAKVNIAKLAKVKG
ncbi:MAG: hypothetical protein IKO87_01820, partial [Kiritimatiellae bacterium]|nr:hypothetical protein [Kiritimatiellia bacterium]